jgi:plastocyanin
MIAAVAIGAVPPALVAQGTVSGRVSITERPGETTTDFSSTVIYLVPKDTSRIRMRTTRASIAMSGRAFVPHVRVVTPGSRVDFPNQDPFSHNIFSSAPGAQFDLGLYPAGKSKDAPFRRSGVYPVYCNIHPRMTAFILVAPSQFHAQAGNDGRWSIEGVPAGDYTLIVWHERARQVDAQLVVAATGASDVTTALDARGYRFVEHKNKFGREYDRNAVRY